tara:strand:- start:818 stop:973 length:156 start_codon:yes stop_codon:yes gene_type:complete
MNNELKKQLKTLNNNELKILIENIYIFCNREYNKNISNYIFNEIGNINKLK